MTELMRWLRAFCGSDGCCLRRGAQVLNGGFVRPRAVDMYGCNGCRLRLAVLEICEETRMIVMALAD
jgi:hypothetical protein